MFFLFFSARGWGAGGVFSISTTATAAATKNPAQYMSLISFGEVLNPASKAAVLSLDSQLQMRGVINSELQVSEGKRRTRYRFHHTGRESVSPVYRLVTSASAS